MPPVQKKTTINYTKKKSQYLVNVGGFFQEAPIGCPHAFPIDGIYMTDYTICEFRCPFGMCNNYKKHRAERFGKGKPHDNVKTTV